MDSYEKSLQTLELPATVDVPAVPHGEKEQSGGQTEDGSISHRFHRQIVE